MGRKTQSKCKDRYVKPQDLLTFGLDTQDNIFGLKRKRGKSVDTNNNSETGTLTAQLENTQEAESSDRDTASIVPNNSQS